MDEENIRNELRKISKVMDGFSLETVKIANIQTELCTVKKENEFIKTELCTVKKENAELKQNVAVLSTELCTVKKENAELKQNVAVLSTELCTVKKENAELKQNVAVLSTELCTVKKENAELKQNVAVLSTELCTVKKENAFLKEYVAVAKNDLQVKVETLSTEVKTLSGANTVLKNLYKASLDNISKLDGEYKDLKNTYDTLRSDVDMLKSTSKASKVEHCNEIKSNVDGGDTLPAVDTEFKSVGDCAVDTEVKSVGDCDNEAKNEPAGAPKYSNSGIKRKPKAQKKREQNETFRQWGTKMNQRKTHKDLWASGLLKFTIELWEDENKFMNEDEILDFLKKNVDQLTTYFSSDESKNRFFLTLIKMCSMRQVSKPKFPEVMRCFENHGPHRNRITEAEIQKFIQIYEGYKV